MGFFEETDALLNRRLNVAKHFPESAVTDKKIGVSFSQIVAD